MSDDKQIRITLTKSPIGNKKDQKATVQALGLRRMHASVVKEDSPTVRGMIYKVRHLVTVEEVGDDETA